MLIRTITSGTKLFSNNDKLYFVKSEDNAGLSGLKGNEIQISYDKHHEVYSLVKSHQNTHNSVKYEVICQNVKCQITLVKRKYQLLLYLRSILDRTAFKHEIEKDLCK